MSDERIMLFICRGHARKGISPLSAQGEAEIARAALRCRQFELDPDNCAILTSPTEEERESAAYFARKFFLSEPVAVEWLNEANIQTHILAKGFLSFSDRQKLIIIVEKPVLEKIAAFFELPFHSIQSGDIFILRYPRGKLERLH